MPSLHLFHHKVTMEEPGADFPCSSKVSQTGKALHRHGHPAGERGTRSKQSVEI